MNDTMSLQAHFSEMFKPVCAPLYDALGIAAAVTARHLTEHGVERNGWEETHLARIHLAHQLSTADLPGFSLRRPMHNGRMLLDSGNGTSLRLLHARLDQVPPPGRNRARLAYYAQLSLPGMELSSALLGLWCIRDGQAVVRIVRPIGTWKYGQRAKVDLDVLLPREGAEFDELSFEPDDEGIEMPTLLLPHEDRAPLPLLER